MIPKKMTHPTFASNALHVATGPGVVRHKEIIRGNANVATERFVLYATA